MRQKHIGNLDSMFKEAWKNISQEEPKKSNLRAVTSKKFRHDLIRNRHTRLRDAELHIVSIC